jgi:hypothetical protein
MKVPLILALLLGEAPLRAQNFSIDWHKVSGGGGASGGGQYSVCGTIGQHDAGAALSGGSFSLTGGFWSSVAVVETPVLVWTNPASITYGTPLSSAQLNAASIVPGTFSYSPQAGTVLNAGGGQVLTVVFAPNDTTDYSSATKTVFLNVTQAPLTVTANSTNHVYGAANSAFTGSIAGLQNSDSITASFSSSATPDSPVGVYLILPVLHDPGARLGNYTVTTNSGALTVNPAALTVTVYSTNRLYAAVNPAFTGSVAGLQNSDDITASFSSTATPASSVGVYPILPILADPGARLGNYIVVTNTGALAINPATLTVTANSTNRPVGAVNPIFTGTVAGIQNGDNITAVYNCAATTNSPPGTYVIIPSFIDPGNRLVNYIVFPTNGVLTVTGAGFSPVITSWSLGSNVFSLSVQAQTGFAYTLQSSDTLPASGWNDGESVMGTGGVIVLSDNNATANSRFYRVRIDPVSIPAPPFLATGLVTYFPFNGNATDASGNGNNGSLPPGVVFTTDRFGNPNAALHFPNGTTDYEAVTTTTQFSSPEDFSLCAWFKFATNGYGYLILFTDSEGGYFDEFDRILSAPLGILNLYLYPGHQYNLSTTNVFDESAWHQAVATLSGAGSRLYLDGVLGAEDPSSTFAQPNDGWWRVGTFLDEPSALDDVRIYNRALSDDEVASLYAYEAANPKSSCDPPPSGIVAWWPGDGAFADIVGTNNGMATGPVVFVAGEVGQAFSFSGTGTVSVPDSPSFQGLTNAMSFEAWIRVPGWTNTLECVFSKGQPWALQRNWDSSSLLFSTTGLDNTDLQGNIPVDDGNWHHVVAGYDGSQKFLYVDGVLDVQVAAQGSITTSDAPAVIGDNPFWAPQGQRLFTGELDEVTLYNRALSPSEIAQIYAAGSAGKCKP